MAAKQTIETAGRRGACRRAMSPVATTASVASMPRLTAAVSLLGPCLLRASQVSLDAPCRLADRIQAGEQQRRGAQVRGRESEQASSLARGDEHEPSER